MIVLGLTGSIGMGKSTVARMFADEGIPVFDADKAVRAMQGPGGALIAPIEAAFPGSTGPDGVNRAVLADMVLHDRAVLRRLEEIVHPLVGEAREAFLAGHRDCPLVVLDVPLLFETGGEKNVEKVAVVSADPDDAADPDDDTVAFDELFAHEEETPEAEDPAAEDPASETVDAAPGHPESEPEPTTATDTPHEKEGDK